MKKQELLKMMDALVEVLIEKRMLVPPEHDLGPEGCWMGILK